jgi:hypothetical protein
MKMLKSMIICDNTDQITNREILIEALSFAKEPRITKDVSVIVDLGDSIGPNTRSSLFRLSVSNFAVEPCHQFIES